MSRKSSVLSELEKKKDDFEHIGVSSIGIFGSVVREEDTPESDIDILVDFEPSSLKYSNFNQLCDILDDTFGEHYDLVTVGGLSPCIGKKILNEVEYVSLTS